MLIIIHNTSGKENVILSAYKEVENQNSELHKLQVEVELTTRLQ